MAQNTPEARAPAQPGGREIFDLDVSFMGWFSLGIVLLVIVTAFCAYALLGGFRVPVPGAAPAAEATTAAPIVTLQSAPQDDLRTYRRAKAAALEGYHWIDRSGGVVQIPIERAMELVATERASQETSPGIAPAAPAAPAPRQGRRP